MIHLVVPGRIDQATGGYRYGARLVAEWRRAGHAVTVHELPGRFPEPDAIARAAARAVPLDGTVVIDGLALPAFYDLPESVKARVLLHHPLGRETGLAPDAARAWLAREGQALQRHARVIVTSRFTVGEVAAMGVPRDRIRVVEPGLDPPPRGRGRAILTVATLTARKDHASAIKALARVRPRRWQWRIIGGEREGGQLRRLRALVRAFGLGARVRFLGEMTTAELAREYARAGMFLLPSRYEGFGMAFAEALAARLPVIGGKAGAVPFTVPRAAGILVRPGDVAALARALRAMTRPAIRARFARHAARARFLPWRETARAFLKAVA